MLVKACLCAVKVCKRSFHNCRSLVKNVLACLSAGNDTTRRFIHRGRLLILLKASLSTVKVCKGSFHHSEHRFPHRFTHRFTHRGGLLMLV